MRKRIAMNWDLEDEVFKMLGGVSGKDISIPLDYGLDIMIACLQSLKKRPLSPDDTLTFYFSQYDYDSDRYMDINIHRDETDEEMQNRLLIEEKNRLQAEKSREECELMDLATLRYLMEKYKHLLPE